jgi:hypothetical protein
MDIGAAGHLIIFFSLLVGFIILGGLVLAYTGYSFLHVLISTSAGTDAMGWPGDPLFDWLFKGWYLAWIAVMSVLPAFLVVSIAHVPPRELLWNCALAGSACLFFPVFLLSSLSGSSRMLLVRGEILGGMGRRFGLTLGFYLVSSAILMGSTSFVWYALLKGSMWLVPLSTATLAIGLLIYARLLGRLGHAITEAPATKKSVGNQGRRGSSSAGKADKWGVPEIPLPHGVKPMKKSASKKKPPKKPLGTAVDPWAVPELEPITRPRKKESRNTDPLGPEEGGYELSPGAAKPVSVSKKLEPRAPADSEMYQMSNAELPPPIKPAPPPALAQVSSYEAELAAPRDRPDLPARPLTTGVFSFPFYPTTLGPLGTISLGLIAMGLLARGLIALFPS